MNWESLDIAKELSLGEDSTRQFKRVIDKEQKLGEEFCAFSNSGGGMIYIGVDNDGTVVGLSPEDLSKHTTRIANAANANVKPPVYPQFKIYEIESKRIIAVYIESGPAKPYSTNADEYYVKSGCDKRKVSQQELLRMFQQSKFLLFDESATNAPFKEKEIVKEKEEGKEVDKVVERDVVDLAKFYVFFERLKDIPFSKAGVTLEQAMRNMNLARENNLTLAGVLLFAVNPQRYKPYCHIKAVNIDGTKTSDTTFLDRSDIEGTLRDQYDGAMLFLRKNLKRLQKGAEFNQRGNLEISEVALTEALVNALVHRDYTKNAPVRLMIFNDRVEIISPGSLPNHLTVENIKNGNSIPRNSIIVSFATKVLPYSGLGTGVSRILEFHPDTEFRDDKNGEQFTIIMKRPA